VDWCLGSGFSETPELEQEQVGRRVTVGELQQKQQSELEGALMLEATVDGELLVRQ
jgi:hypothetical protein